MCPTAFSWCSENAIMIGNIALKVVFFTFILKDV
jgi:hypothetical protein